VADDVALYLAGKPIKARPVGRIQRAVRLVRRNPVTSSLVTLLALSLIAGAAIGIALAIKASRYADDSKHHLYVAHMNLAQQYWDAGRAGPVLDILRRYIPKEGEEDIRGWEWHYQWSLCHRELRRFGEWKAGVQCVAVSPDGTLTAAASDDGLIQVFDTATGDLRARLTEHQDAAYALAFSPDGAVLASGGVDRTIRLWDVSGFKFQVSGSKSATPLPGGEKPAVGQSNVKPETSNQKRNPNLKPIATLSRHTNDIRGLAFSPDSSQLVSSSEDGNAWLWDMKTHEALRSVHTGPARAIAFHPDGQRFACAARDGVIHLWNIATVEKTASWPAHSDNVYGLAFNRAGSRLFSAGTDCVINCVDTSTDDEVWSVKHAAGFNCLALAEDERILAVGCDDQTIRLYDAVTGEVVDIYRGHTNWVQGTAFLSDGSRVVSASSDGTVRLWNELCADEGRALTGHELQVTSVAYSPDGRTIATASIDGVITLFDPTVGLLRRRLFGPTFGATVVAFGPYGRRLAAGSVDRTVYLWNMPDLRDDKILRGHTDSLGGVAFGNDGKLLASSSADETVHVWDSEQQRARHTFRANAGSAFSVAFSPDDKWLVSGHDDGAARLWSVDDGELRCVCRGHGRNVRGVCFSPEGDWFASSGGDGTIRLWSSSTGTELQKLSGHDGTVFSISVSADSSRIVSGGQDQTVKLWDIRSGQELRTFRFGEPVRSVAFSPDGRQIVASGANGAVRIWEAARAGKSGFGSPSEATVTEIDREALGLVIGLMERGLTKPQAQALLPPEGRVLERGESLPLSATTSVPARIAALAILDEFPLDEFASRAGHRLADAGDWRAAAAAFGRACEASPHDCEHWCMLALCKLKGGNHEGYLEVCRAMVQQFKNDERLAVINRLLTTCLVVPGMPPDELEPFAKRLDSRIHVFKDNEWLDCARRIMLARIALRRGDTNTAEQFIYTAPAINTDGIQWYSLRAIVQAVRGKTEAHQSLAQADQYFNGAPMHWSARVIYEFVREEARVAIERHLAGDAATTGGVEKSGDRIDPRQ
jgi:WD40 repeat protein